MIIDLAPNNDVAFRFGDRVRVYRDSEFFGEGHIIGVASSEELDLLYKANTVSWLPSDRIVESIFIASPIFKVMHDYCYHLNKIVGQDVWQDENWSSKTYTVTNLSTQVKEQK